MSVDVASWQGQVLLGRYEVRAQVAQGGMANILIARDRNIDADVILKVPRPSMLAEGDFAARFLREVKSMVQMSHPHIVRILDAGECDGIPFSVMQYLAGGTLRDHQKRDAASQPVRMRAEELIKPLAEIA